METLGEQEEWILIKAKWGAWHESWQAVLSLPLCEEEGESGCISVVGFFIYLKKGSCVLEVMKSMNRDRTS